MDKESWRRGGDSRPDPRGETSFDELAKGLASRSISRRQAVRWMGGALLGSVLAIVPGVEAFAAPGQPKGRCPAGFVNCRGTCVRIQNNPSHCGGCFIQCGPDEVCCGSQCSNLCDDPLNCGFCGNACPEGAECQGCGSCVCPSGTIECGGACVSETCPEGQFFNPVLCQCDEPGVCAFAGACPTNPCGPPEDPESCGCVLTAEGSTFCLQHGQCGQPCASTAECPAGTACVETCCGFACQFPCGAAPVAAPDVSASGGRTTNGR
jgi:hypothetical protein